MQPSAPTTPRPIPPPRDPMNETRSEAPSRRSLRAAAWAEAVLWAAALVCFAAAGWLAFEANRYEWFGVELATAEELAEAGASSDGVGLPPEGTPIALLEIPRLGLEVTVAEGTADSVLRRSVGRLRASAPLGGRGNTALAGHRDTHFRRLEEIAAGDRIVLSGPLGRREYEVAWTRVVEPDETWVADTRSVRAPPELTLVTCYPFRWVGTAPQRFVVRANLVAEDATLTPTREIPPASGAANAGSARTAALR